MKKEESNPSKCPICGRPTHKQSKYCIFHASAEEKTEKEFKKALKEYIDKIQKEDGIYDFREFIFVGNINFKENLNVTIFKDADFSEATFKRYAYFGEATFEGKANFRKVTFEGKADFRKAIFKRYTDFGKTTFERDTDFKEVTFEGKANFEKAAFEGKADFGETTFERNVDFRKVTFKVKNDFGEATFEGKANFEKVTFEGKANFEKVAFKKNTYFKEVTFEGKADFRKAIFKKNADFRKAIFERYTGFRETAFERHTDFREAAFRGYTDFWKAIFRGYTDFKKTVFEGYGSFQKVNFEEYAGFKETIFRGYADFGKATFKEYADFEKPVFEEYAGFRKAIFRGYAGFKEATYRGSADFREVTFEVDADFRLKYFIKIINFSGIKVFSGKKLFIRLINEEGKISFERAYLENIYLDIELVEGVLIDFTDASLRNTKIKKVQIENHILQEKEKKFSKAIEIYLLLKNNFRSIGRYNDESWASKKEKDMERKSNCHFKSLHKWLWSCFLNGIFGYGEQPGKVIISAISIILIFTFLFMSSGISDAGIGGSISKNFIDCVYFSVITFTTLGYGDFRPLEGWSRIFAGSEAFIGALMMALFIYTFARRTGGN